MLTIVPTPIGNLSDITLRALEVLRSADLILCEDTRITRKLLDRHEITTPLSPYHQFNEHKKVNKILGDLRAGSRIALVSDAGTPGISDPGYLLVRTCIEHDIKLECLPGPTALIPAVVLSGLPIHRFYFEGFLPAKKGRNTRLEYLSSLEDTFVLYESPHRVIKTLGQLSDHCGPDRPASLVRELSKRFEECLRGSLHEIHQILSDRAKVKGEFVLVVAGRD
jgi:16S rRNA (cytidine1402-2'-O)-methyltransferase